MPLQRALTLQLPLRLVAVRETHRPLAKQTRTHIGGHNHNHIAKRNRPSVVVGEHAVIHHLQQNVGQISVRLLNLIQQHHRMRIFQHRFREQPPWSNPT